MYNPTLTFTVVVFLFVTILVRFPCGTFHIKTFSGAQLKHQGQLVGRGQPSAGSRASMDVAHPSFRVLVTGTEPECSVPFRAVPGFSNDLISARSEAHCARMRSHTSLSGTSTGCGFPATFRLIGKGMFISGQARVTSYLP